MKKILILLIATAMMLTACQAKTATEQPTKPTTQSQPTTPTIKETKPTTSAETKLTVTEETIPTEATPKATEATQKPTEADKPVETTKPTETAATEAPKPVHSHNYSASIQSPTCSEQGYTLHTCSCGESYTDSYVNALGHGYTDSVVAATATEQGYTQHTCSRCGDSYKDNYTPIQRIEIISEADVLAVCAEACAYAESLGLRVDSTAASWTASCVCDRYSGGYMSREEGLAYIRKTYFEDAEDFASRGYAAFYPLYWADGDDWRFVGAFSFS